MSALLIDRCVRRSRLAQELFDNALKAPEQEDVAELVGEAVELSRLLQRAWGIYTQTFFTPGVGDMISFAESLDAATNTALQLATTLQALNEQASTVLDKENDSLQTARSKAPRIDVVELHRQLEQSRKDIANGDWRSIEDILAEYSNEPKHAG